MLFMGCQMGDRQNDVPQSTPPNIGLRAPAIKLGHWFEPADLSTDVQDSPLRLVVASSDLRPLDSSIVKAIQDSLVLEEYTSRTVVGTRVDISTKRDLRNPERATMTIFTLVPDNKLAGRWYSMSVELPAGFSKPGKIQTRINPESAPTLKRITICNKGNGTSLTASFTEPVTWTGSDAVGVVGSGAKSTCIHTSTSAVLSARHWTCPNVAGEASFLIDVASFSNVAGKSASALNGAKTLSVKHSAPTAGPCQTIEAP